MFGFCVPELESTANTLKEVADMASAAGSAVTGGMSAGDQMTAIIVDMRKAWPVIIYGALTSLVVTFIYVFVLKWMAKPLLYLSILMMLVLMGGGGAYLWLTQLKMPDLQSNPDGEDTANSQKQMYQIAAYVLWALAAIYMIFICCSCSNIMLAANIVKAASDFLSSNTRIIFMPLFMYLLMVPIVCCWLYSVLSLASIGTPVYKENSYIGSMIYQDEVKYAFTFMLFGLFWIIAFLDAVQMFVVASTTCMWYF